MKIMVAVSAGTDDPTRATLGMAGALNAAKQGHEVTVWLQGEAAVIANTNVYPNIQGLNMPAMKDIVEDLVERGVPMWVCEACGKGRDVGPENWLRTAEYRNMGDYVAAVVEADRSLSF